MRKQLAWRSRLWNSRSRISASRRTRSGVSPFRSTEIRFALPPGIGLADLPALPATSIREHDGGVLITTRDGVSAIHDLSGWALERHLPLAGLSLSQPTLEDIYLALTADEREEALP